MSKTTSAGTVYFVYDVGGKLIAEYGGQTANGGTSYLTADQLGSTRVVTNSSGAVIARHDYLPFGGEIGAVGGRTAQGYGALDDTRQKFTSKERDTESGLDYFGARYYANAMGRFLTPDWSGGAVGVPYADSYDPQSLDLYCYVRNNPLARADLDGHGVPSWPVGLGPPPADDGADIHKTTTTQVIQQERGGGQVVMQATITITETETVHVDDKGTVVGTAPTTTSATAENTGNAARLYSPEQLSTMANVAQNIVQVSREKGFDPTIALGIAQTETHMGTLQSQEASPAKQSDVNPMQLSSSNGSIKPIVDLRSNIRGAIDVYNRGAGSTLNESLQTYNNQANKAAYARTAEGHIDEIRSSVSSVTQHFSNGHVVVD